MVTDDDDDGLWELMDGLAFYTPIIWFDLVTPVTIRMMGPCINIIYAFSL